jgi:hypothetical protein
MNASGLTMISSYAVSITTTDNTLLTQLITQNLQNFTQNNELGDILAVFTTGGWFPSIKSISPLFFYV